MVVFESLADVSRADGSLVGSKAKALANLAAHGFEVPAAMCISTEGYDQYMSATNLRDRVLFELGRKRFEDMRWEEIWDAALRIRNLFLITPLPADLHALLHQAVACQFGDAPVVVRSSAPGEDSTEASFAGLHESFVNVRGPAEVLKHVRLVWASLWSDAALLYRQELGLDVRRSRMAVIVQALVEGECSGVAFSREPGGADHAVVEAVYGLNAGLVDGTIEPDRWTVDRRDRRVMAHNEPVREHAMAAMASGITRIPLAPERARHPPLTELEVQSVCQLALDAEQQFGAPQDVEWTRAGDSLNVLQSRPITTLSNAVGEEDRRPWYRSLTRSFENLKALRRRLEDEVVPGMQREAAELARLDPATLTDADLAAEVKRRETICRRWREAYWDDCIPFAHGVRLFGQYYNDLVQPQNPYEFMDLLGGTAMLSVTRNQALEALASMIREEPDLRETIRRRDLAAFPVEFSQALEAFLRKHGDVSATAAAASTAFLDFLLELANAPSTGASAPGADAERLCRDFLASVPDSNRARAEEILDLARASHRWRDDDNVYLDAVETQWRRACNELRRRNVPSAGAGASCTEGVAEAGLKHHHSGRTPESVSAPGPSPLPRQLVGQPASPGVATGRARVVVRQEELLGFKRGDVLVCDALSPTMTFVIPLASAVVERRGGMLIHGAIIAREYGIPCVTGVPDAAELIRTGSRVTVDGYLGIVRVE